MDADTPKIIIAQDQNEICAEQQIACKLVDFKVPKFGSYFFTPFTSTASGTSSPDGTATSAGTIISGGTTVSGYQTGFIPNPGVIDHPQKILDLLNQDQAGDHHMSNPFLDGVDYEA